MMISWVFMAAKSTSFPLLYGTTSTGTSKIWSCHVHVFTSTESHITITHGLVDGKQQTTLRRVCEGKNLGKANETTAHEQALNEAQSLWLKKQDKGYTETIPTTGKTKGKSPGKTTSSRLPMLAHQFVERKHDLVWPVFVQPKLNGVRCLIERTGDTVRFYSRGNKEFMGLSHLIPDCLAVMKDGQMIDGELYSHGDISFQELVSLVKNGKGQDQAKVKRYVHFHNYDVCADVPFKVRKTMLVKNYGNLHPVQTEVARSEDDVHRYHQLFAEQGYEGVMIRSGGDEPYRAQYRSTTLLKLKAMQDAEFEIVGAKEGVGKAEGQAVFIVRVAPGVECAVRMKGSDESRQEQWTNRKDYMGKMVTVQFQSFSDDGNLVFPVGLAIRDYE